MTDAAWPASQLLLAIAACVDPLFSTVTTHTTHPIILTVDM